ncbi:Uncharacterized membrane-anchored protein YitT, contains DUF161 and DUF2179 domains [Pisciglobus halotolerans]|uniref:Uncharacterized membrane-anchored protein YitT, contains DUF161 and DUF2179 domains n=1 Tax=Pisciglobus halotolerans TaxID=745365 RepID=A0A1I3BDP2_9LACT|nr:Uncharacterized membrane-anchored protein YitT, contains DUF161 and DUF2179 domains [Pisciglobus halotolerans]
MKKVASKYTLSAMDILYVLIGSLIAGVSFKVFLLPNNIVSGGVSGISTILNTLFSWDPAMIQFALNIPLLALCYVALGKASFYKTVLGSLAMPAFIGLFSFLEPVTDSQLLAALFGGLTSGIGIGLVYRAKASTGGTSIVAQVVHEYLHLPLGLSAGLVDGLVIVAAFAAFDAETIMYSMIALFIVSRTIDLIQVGLNRSKSVLIISDYPNEIKTAIFKNVNRGVTNLGIKGGYGNTDKEMIMCVVAEHEFTLLKDTILAVDPKAFVVVTSASEVWGAGFTLEREFNLNL